MRTALICLAVVAQVALSTYAESIQKIPLYRYNKRTSRDDFVSADGEDLNNGMLGGLLQIGNPPQNFTVAFDTSSGFSWVRGIQCGGDNCEGRQAFDSRNSTTVVSTGRSYTYNYGKGIVYTTIYEDTFRFSGIEVKNMLFGGTYRMENFEKGFDGYLGLGRDVNLNLTDAVQYAKRDAPASGFVPNAYQQGSGVQSAQFGMYTTSTGNGFSESGSTPASSSMAMYSASSSPSGNNGFTPSGNNGFTSGNAVTSGGFGFMKRSSDEPAGYLILGGIDTDAIKGALYHIKASTDEDGSGSWDVPVTEVEFVDDLKFHVHSKAKAVLSTSTDVIGLPNKQADEFKKHWYAEYDKPDNTYKIPCCLMDRLTAFKIRLGSVSATIPPSYYSHARETTSCCDMCRTHIGRSESDTDYVIGTAFTNSFYTQFDSTKQRVSLAMKKSHKKHDGLQLCNK